MVLAEAPERTKAERKAADTVIAALGTRYGNRLATSQAVLRLDIPTRNLGGRTLIWVAKLTRQPAA